MVDIEIVAMEEVPDVAKIYGVERCPTLLRIGDYGLITKITGFNKRMYDEVVAKITDEESL